VEFKEGNFQSWKVMENDCGHGKVMELGRGIFLTEE